MAEALCDIHDYAMYKTLMKEVRGIESQIVNYQNYLRQNIYTKQLNEYKLIGEQMIKEEQERWNNLIKDYKMELCKKVDLLQQKQQEDEEELKRALEHPREAAK